MKKNLAVRVYGKVQGVSFRFFIENEAVRFGLKGWIKNESDETVSIEVEGKFSKLKDFLDQCRKGSPRAQVEKVEYEFSDKLKNYENFRILR